MAAAKKAKRILIIDDEESLRNSLNVFLAVKGYKVATAANSTDGLKIMEEFDPEILILDLHLREELTGIDILKKVRFVRPDLAIIVMTGFDDDEEIKEKCFEAGADKFICKPATPNEILAALGTIKNAGR